MVDSQKESNLLLMEDQSLHIEIVLFMEVLQIEMTLLLIEGQILPIEARLKEHQALHIKSHMKDQALHNEKAHPNHISYVIIQNDK